MLIIISIIVGYTLGVAPFLYMVKKTKEENKQNVESKKIDRETNKIFDEWLNGEKSQNEQENTNSLADIYEEYITGISKGGNANGK